ncbi:AraC family transcriptional regulator [Pseudomonas denitrificans (nom. rej.)]|uniref:AraC family transcriptional regulator n=1 Tax=Pseudomonas denitrificans TaxID=43306 RepID=A0A9X7R3V5_PSEDE|nr:AraC family transcriptional regulator [Pseudomonas denitrificans (nom. rej.)]QEY70975.1 AraC family transcriptional regulator [Pseudomonas denitrificans (nom. rej.)]
MQSLLSERSRVFERADPYAVSGYVNQHVGTHDLRLPAHGHPQASLNHRRFASLDLCRISYGGAVRVTSPALESIFHLQILLSGHCLWRGQRQEHYLAPGELLLINPDDPVDLTYSDDCEKFILKIPVTLLEAVCAEQRWNHPRAGVRFTENRYQLGELEGFVNLLSMVCQESEAGERLARVDEHYQQIVASKLLTLLKTNVSREPIAGASASFERIEAYIEGHLREDIDVEALARQASMSLRSLYALFERRAGATPRQYIRRLKLERIRACLSDPACPVRNVTELALDYGFLHLGRFAEGYRQQFGELPSETLKRRS